MLFFYGIYEKNSCKQEKNLYNIPGLFLSGPTSTGKTEIALEIGTLFGNPISKDLRNFMFFMGPTSSIFDLMVFASLWFGFGLRLPESALFQTIWFSYGVVSNLIGLHIIRTSKMPFIKSNASIPVYATSILLSIVALIVPFTFIGKWIGLVPFAPIYLVVIIGFPILYCFIASFVKKLYIRKYGEWI